MFRPLNAKPFKTILMIPNHKLRSEKSMQHFAVAEHLLVRLSIFFSCFFVVAPFVW